MRFNFQVSSFSLIIMINQVCFFAIRNCSLVFTLFFFSQMFEEFVCFRKTLEIGVAVTSRDATTFTESLDEHLSLASDIVTIAINAPEDNDFSVSDFERHVTILIPLTKGQRVSDPRCFRLDANNVLEESGCTVEKFEPSKFVECKCSSQFTRSFMIIDVAPERDQEGYHKESKSLEFYASVAKTENPDPASYRFEKQIVPPADDVEFTTNAEGLNLLVVFLVLISFVSCITCVYRWCNKPVDSTKKGKIGLSCHVIVCNFGAFGFFCLAMLIDDSFVKTLCLSSAIGFLAGTGLCVWSIFVHDKIRQFVVIQCRHISMLYVIILSMTVVCFLLTQFTGWPIVAFGCLISALMSTFTILLFVFEQWPQPVSKNFSERQEAAIDVRMKQCESEFSVNGGTTEGKATLDLDLSDTTSSVSRTLSDEQSGEGCISPSDIKRALVFMLAVYGLLCAGLVLLFLKGPACFEILVFISSCALILPATALAYIVCVNRVVKGLSSPKIQFSKRNRTESEKPICKPVGNRKHHASSSHQSDSDVECGMEADEATFDNPDDDDQDA